MQKEVVILGASGFLGYNLFGHLKSSLKDYKITGTYYQHKRSEEFFFLDICDKKQLGTYLLGNEPEILILLAGSKDLQRCEKNYSFAHAINTQPIIDIVEIIEKHNLNTHILFFSTDYVFDGQHESYKDSDIPDPSTNYGKSNFEAEKRLLNSSVSFNIIRTSAVMGHGARFFDWLIDSLKKSKETDLFKDILFTPTHLVLLANLTEIFIRNYKENNKQKILHFVGEKSFSRYSFGIMVATVMGKRDLIVASQASGIFQKNLILEQSEFARNNKNIKMEEFLEMELCNDKIH
jgi:dTDP-4-dehydrorhamnose reductase